MATTTFERFERFALNEQSGQYASDGSSYDDNDDDGDDDDDDVMGMKDEASSGEDVDDDGHDSATTLDSPSNESARAKHEMEISPAPRRRKDASEPGVAASTTTSAAAPGAKTTTKTKRNKTSKASANSAKAAPKPRARKAAASHSSDEQRAVERTAAMAKRKQASIDQRRKRNREAMQRARQRDKDYMDGLRDTARELERKHNALLARVDERLAVASIAGAHVSVRVAELQQRLQAAREQAEALKRQNLQFLDDIGDRIKREDRMEGLLRELMREQAAQEHVLNEIFRESLSESQLRAFYTEERAMHEILRSRHDRRHVERCGFASAVVGEIFGWSTQHEVAEGGRTFHFSFTKTFRNVRAARVMEQNWSNAMKMVSYRNAVEAATQHWYVVQRINDDTYLLAREICDPVRAGEVIRLLYLRFRLDEDDGSYSVVTQSVQDDAQQALLYEGVKDVWATEACMWTLFTPVLERASDGSVLEHCQIKMVGCSTVGSEAAARQNVLETILGLLRWENINVGPMLSLTNT